MPLHAFWQEPLPAALPPARKRGAAAFAFHAGAESVLVFARALRWLISAFHRAETAFWGDLKAVIVRMSKALSILHDWATVELVVLANCQLGWPSSQSSPTGKEGPATAGPARVVLTELTVSEHYLLIFGLL
jgi:hypothetical protein